jgi:predicted hotdog family 3-hydroxylacyl-ACP dehydratase
MAVWYARREGAPAVEVGVQVSLNGSYLPPVAVTYGLLPPQTTMTLPVQTAVWYSRGNGALTVEVGAQVSLTGSYRLPVFKKRTPELLMVSPPHTIMTAPVQIAV